MRLGLVGSVLLGAALGSSRGLFAQHAPLAPLPQFPAFATPASSLYVAADQSGVRVRPVEPRFARRQTYQFTRPRSVKALYVNAWAFTGARLWDLIRLADSTEINAFVIDVKDDTGCLLYRSVVATAEGIGANHCAHLASVRTRLDSVVAHGIYPIARIVVAKDPLLAERKSQWSVQQVGGGLWRDRIGIAWVDAFNDSVWVYAADLGREAVKLGFAEVQFDYVRFPDEPRERMATAIFPARRGGESQRGAVRRHVQLLADRIKPLGAPVTFDIFGLTASADGDLGIGQVWEDFAGVADVVLPMVYPSHYYHGAYGFDTPNAHPYRIVQLALRDALARSRDLPNPALIRPFLQAFTLGRRLPRYTPFEIREQIRAAEELGIDSWVLWNPRSVYQRDSLRPYRTTARASAAAGGGSQ